MSLFDKLLEQIAPIPGIEVPPKVYLEMEPEVIDYEENYSLTIRFPIKERYQNPIGHMQGGMIVTAVDNTFGPLSYLLAPPSVTTQLNTQYIRPVLPTDKHIDVTATLVEKTNGQLILKAKVLNEKRKIVAICQATQQIIRTLS